MTPRWNLQFIVSYTSKRAQLTRISNSSIADITNAKAASSPPVVSFLRGVLIAQRAINGYTRYWNRGIMARIRKGLTTCIWSGLMLKEVPLMSPRI